MLKNIDVAAFHEPIKNFLINNLTKQTCATLASLLAIDYATRLGSSGVASDYADNCVSKLKRYLKSQVITDSSFSTALTLFAVAISSEDMNFHDKNNILNQEASQDAAIDALIAMHFGDYSSELQGQIKLVLKGLLANSQVTEVLNYFSSEPQIIKNIVANSLKASNKQNEMNDYASRELGKIFHKNIALRTRSNTFKQQVASITTGLVTLAMATFCAVVGGAALPVIILPAAILSLKFAPKVGEKLGETILNYDNNFKLDKKNFQAIKNKILHTIIEAPAILKQQAKELTKDRTLQDISKHRSAELSAIKQNLQSHKSEMETSAPVIAANKKTKDVKGRLV